MGKLHSFIVRNSNFEKFPITTLLSEELRKEILKQKKVNRKIWLFCAATEENIGDDALTYAGMNLLEKTFGQKPLTTSREIYWENAPFIEKYISKKDVIFIAGGGFLGSIWPEMQEEVTEIVKKHPSNTIIILPQSIAWPEPKNPTLEESKTAYAACKKLIILARDQKSSEILKETYPDKKVLLASDLALTFDWQKLLSSQERKGCLLCFRTDKEKLISKEEQGYVEKWCDSKFKKIRFEDNIPLGMRLQNIQLKELMMLKLTQYLKSELIVTDRLHGMIFSAITGTPCIVLSNANHKIREVYYSLKNKAPITLIEEVIELEKAAENVMAQEHIKVQSQENQFINIIHNLLID